MPWEPMSRDDAEQMVEAIPPGYAALSQAEAQKRIEAILVLQDMPPDKIKRVLVEAFGPID